MAFKRTRGGLLYALQAVVVGLMQVSYWAIGSPTGLALALVAGLYLVYFAPRWPLWRKLYRAQRYMEDRIRLQEAGAQTWVTPFLTVIVPLGLVASAAHPGPLLPLVGVSAALAVAAIGSGRLPADAPILALATIIAHHTLALPYGALPLGHVPWVRTGLLPAGWGLVEHFAWVRSGGGATC